MLRETVNWRLYDLIFQSFTLHKQGHGLGSRILLRSAFESLATLIYLNQLMQMVVDGHLPFHEFGEKTPTLLVGSRTTETKKKSINVLTVLKKCDNRYPGLRAFYEELSESAHPNYEGLCLGYSEIDRNKHETSFSSKWMELFGTSTSG